MRDNHFKFQQLNLPATLKIMDKFHALVKLVKKNTADVENQLP